MLRWQTAGESHGEALVAMIEGLPAGVISPRRILLARWRVVVLGMVVARDEVRAGQGSYADWCAFW